MDPDSEILFSVPAPSDGIETVLVLSGIGLLIIAILAGLEHREKLKPIIDWLKIHPWEKASTAVNLLSWGALILVGPVAAVLFVMAVAEAYALLQQEGASGSSFGSLGRGAVIVALIGAPFVIWRSVVAQKTVNLTEQGHITDRINTAVQGLAAQKEVNQIGRPVIFRVSDPNADERGECQTNIEWKDQDLQIPDGMYAAEEGNWQLFTETQPNLEVRIGAIYALERIAQDSDRDHVQIMEILCAYIRQNAPAPAKDDWPELKMHDSEDEGPLEADWGERLEKFEQDQETAKANLKPREDIQTALTVIGRRSAKQRRLEAGRGVEAPFPFDTDCPDYDGQEQGHDRVALDAYRETLEKWREILDEYRGYRLDLREADLRGADLSEADLKGARLNGTYLQGADLWDTQMQGADLQRARLQGAVLEGTRLQCANLQQAWLQGADLWRARSQRDGEQERQVQAGAQLQGVDLRKARLQKVLIMAARMEWADLRDASMQGASLPDARLQNANLVNARLQNTNLSGALLQGAKLGGSRLQRANLDKAKFDEETKLEDLQVRFSGGGHLQAESVFAEASFIGASVKSVDFTKNPKITKHLQNMFGDGSVTLPGGHGPEHRNWPRHWPKFEMEQSDFRDEKCKWRANPDGYTPPDPPDPETTA